MCSETSGRSIFLRLGNASVLDMAKVGRWPFLARDRDKHTRTVHCGVSFPSTGRPPSLPHSFRCSTVYIRAAFLPPSRPTHAGQIMTSPHTMHLGSPTMMARGAIFSSFTATSTCRNITLSALLVRDLEHVALWWWSMNVGHFCTGPYPCSSWLCGRLRGFRLLWLSHS